MHIYITVCKRSPTFCDICKCFHCLLLLSLSPLLTAVFCLFLMVLFILYGTMFLFQGECLCFYYSACMATEVYVCTVGEHACVAS